ncbi:MAG: hypothetical protein UX68_C0019G0026 [Parcubacteria group bacterium GW2011_GWA2_46_9]|nr:MAG: hypothetical protein UX68_C0019G0026 [Parcubacteria group bacterium GW2011_GWA2_46_9]
MLCLFEALAKEGHGHKDQKIMKNLFTLCIIHQHPKILLGMKKRGLGAGRWNGFGGKVKEGEPIEEAVLRETKEEVGVIATGIERRGIINFEFNGNPEILEVHIFKADNFLGEPIESDEMKPQWFHTDEIPFGNMWSDDIYWMPLFLSGKKFKGKFLFGKSDVILEYRLKEVEEI